MLRALPEIVDVERFAGSRAGPRADLIIEIPHGATTTADFQAVERRLESPLPANLSDFFHVNTDAGAPELAVAIAKAFVERQPNRSVVILRCRVPRTFIDCNRRIDAKPEEFRAGKVTPGLMPWVTSERDRALLLERYGAYVNAVDEAANEVMPAGAMVLLHTYAPRSVGVEVDLNIVPALHAAYAPAVEPTWPLRPQVDVIGTTVEGEQLAPQPVVNTLRDELRALDITMATGESYPLHPSTLAFGHVKRFPGRVVCVEVRRDLLADPWTPFAQMRIGQAQCQRLAAPFVRALEAFF